MLEAISIVKQRAETLTELTVQRQNETPINTADPFQAEIDAQISVLLTNIVEQLEALEQRVQAQGMSTGQNDFGTPEMIHGLEIRKEPSDAE